MYCIKLICILLSGLSVEYFIAADDLLTCLPLNTTSLHAVALRILEGLDLLTQFNFSDAWLTLGPVYQSIVSTQLVYLLNSLTHKLVYYRAIDSQSTQYNLYQYFGLFTGLFIKLFVTNNSFSYRTAS